MVQANTNDDDDDDDGDDGEVKVEVFSEYVPRGMTRGVQHPAEVRQYVLRHSSPRCSPCPRRTQVIVHVQPSRQRPPAHVEQDRSTSLDRSVVLLKLHIFLIALHATDSSFFSQIT